MILIFSYTKTSLFSSVLMTQKCRWYATPKQAPSPNWMDFISLFFLPPLCHIFRRDNWWWIASRSKQTNKLFYTYSCSFNAIHWVLWVLMKRRKRRKMRFRFRVKIFSYLFYYYFVHHTHKKFCFDETERGTIWRLRIFLWGGWGMIFDGLIKKGNLENLVLNKFRKILSFPRSEMK